MKPADMLTLSLSGRLTNASADLDQSFGILDDPNYSLSGEEKLLGGYVSYSSPGKFWRQRFGGHYYDIDRALDDTFDSDHPNDSQKSTFEGSRLKFDWQHTLSLSESSPLTLGIETESEKFSQALSFTSAFGNFISSVPTAEARTTSAYALMLSAV